MVPDFYAILGVDPQVDTAAIEQALAKCQPMWASGTRNPKRKHEFQSYLDRIPEIRKSLLHDPNVRAAYDAERAAGLRVERDRKLDELQTFVRLRTAKGGLTPADRVRLDDKAKGLGLDVDDVARMTHGLPQLAEADGAAPDDEPDEPPPTVLDATTRRQIRVALEHLKRDNLYHVLDLPYDASPAEVVRRADEERARWMQKAQVTAEKTAWLEAVSYAQTHLATPEGRTRYDWTLIIEAEETFRDLVGFAVDGLPRLDDATKVTLLEEATARGLVPDRAGRLIRRVCRERGVGSDLPAPAEPGVKPVRYLRCRTCRGLTDFGAVAKHPEAAACRHCGASLRWDCPVCAQTRWADQERCACGFPASSREPLLRHFEAAQGLFKSRDYAEALEHLKRIREIAPRHGPSRKAIDKVKERLVEVERVRGAFETARAKRHLVAARSALDAWGKIADPMADDLRDARDELIRSLREAQGLAAQGRALLASDPAGARNLLRRALTIAADLPEAREGLRSCPPDPPGILKAHLDGRRVAFRWSPPAPDGLGPLTFRVVRKRAGVPEHPGDGKTIAEVAEAEAFDADPPSGEPVGYAVFSRRGDAQSPTGPGVGPMLVLAEVEGVRVDARSGEVDLTWTPPPGAVEVRVARKIGAPPAGPDDGDRIPSAAGQVRDRGLEDDRVYHYGLYAVYRLADGKARASRGVVVSATPHPTIAGITQVQLGQEPGGVLRLSWPMPDRGQIRVLRTTRPLPYPFNTRVTADDLQPLAGQWLETPTADQAYDPKPPALGVCYYTPLTAWNGCLTVGRGVAYSCLPDPTDLRAVRSGSNGRVFLRWRWTPQAGQSLVLLKQGGEPHGPNDSKAQVFPVQETEYSRTGSYTLNLPQADPANGVGPWHVAVHSVATIEGERVVSPGLDPTCRTVVPGPNPEVTLSYKIRKPLLPGRPWILTLQTEPPGMAVPPTALVAHARTVPLTADDGAIVQRFGAAKDGQALPIRPGDVDLARQRLRLFPDPQAAPDGQAPVRMRHPEFEPARV